MRIAGTLLVGMVFVLSEAVAPAQVDERSSLSVLYVAEPDEQYAERRAAFERFLAQRFETVAVGRHGSVDPAAVDAADVVLLDWHYDPDAAESPLGPRESWHKPTVLLGSAGLMTAMKWEVLGGSG